jgi:hypothetical protein
MIAAHGPILEGLGQIVGSIGVITTGVAAIITAYFSTRSAKRKAASECDERIKELNKMFYSGIKLADQRPRRRKGDL